MKKGIVGVGLAVALTGVVAAPAIVPVTAAYAEDSYVEVSDATALQNALNEGKNVKLTASITADINVKKGVSAKIDLNGQTLDGYVDVYGNLTVLDSTATQPTVNGTTVSGYAGGKVTCSKGWPVLVGEGGVFTLESGSVQTPSGSAIWVRGNRNPTGSTDVAPIASTVNINGGYVVAYGSDYVIGVEARGAVLNANGGIVESTDGVVLGGNGTDSQKWYCGGTTINVTGGTYVGHVKTDGDLACGVYHPQNGTLNISGGDFIIENGVGVLMRGGTLNVTGGSITTTGNASGTVGDSRVISGCYGVFVDGSAAYPSSKESLSASVSGGAVKTDGADSITQSTTTSAGYVTPSTTVTGGTFESLNNLVAAAKFMPEGYAVETTDGETFTVKTDESAKAESSYVIPAKMKDGSSTLNIYFSGDDAEKNAGNFIGGDDSGDSPFEPIKKDDIKTLNYYVNVHYDANGGGKLDTTYFTFTADEVKDDTLYVNSEEFATATREGYNFAGWYLYDPEDPTKAAEPLTKYLNDKGELEIELDEDDFQTSDNEWDVYLRASWTYATYTVKFDSNGGSEVKDVTLDVDDEGLATLKEADLPKNPTREGYKFVGWQEKDEDGTYDLVEYPDHFTAGETAEESTTTLKASWITDHVVVNFDSNGGTAVDSVVLKTNDQNFATFSKNDLPKNPTREGYTFAGWQIYAMVDEDGTLAWVDADLTETQFGAAETEEGATFTVRASWTRNDESASKKDDESSKKALPKTGDASLIATVAAGLAGLSAAGAGLVTKRRNK